MPIYIAQITRRSNEFHHYTIHPDSNSRYAIERSHHPKRKIFTLVDVPIPLEEYRVAVQQDYEETGYFLDRVIIVKVIEGRLWRFSSVDTPHKPLGQQYIFRNGAIMQRDLASPAAAAEPFRFAAKRKVNK